jgi:hypothetical protein
MYDPNAAEMQGKHLIEGVEFEVFRASDHPDLKLPQGWWWDIPLCRTDTPIHPRLDGEYRYANGPFDTSAAAYDHAMTNDGDADA